MRPPTMQCQFYLIGDEPSSAQSVDVDTRWKLEDLQRAVGLVFHIAQPLDDVLKSALTLANSSSPIGLLIDGKPVQSPQGPPGLPLVGSFYEIFSDHLGNHYRLFRKYGPVIKTTNMGCFAESIYMTKKITENHPLWGVKDNTAIFIGDTETENWRLAHKYLPPAMGPKAVRHYTGLMRLDARDESWNVYQYMVKLASRTVGSISLGKDFQHFTSIDSPLHPIVTNIASLLSLNKKITARGEWYCRLPFGDPARLRTVQHTIYTVLQEAIDEVAARSTSKDAPMSEPALSASCVVDYLLHAVDEKGEHFPTGLILANTLIVTGAGFTTTSALLSWLIYCLVTYEGTQDRLYSELVDYGIVGPDGEPNKTTWTPDLHTPGRTTKTDVVLPGGCRLPVNSVIHDPFRFNPDRWDSDEVKKLHRCAYVPFATERRGCIGFNFALLEVKVILAELVSRYEFVRDGIESIEYDPEFQLIRPLNFYVRAKRRF
ncbi:cytochrome P450 [Aspergillus desertorum]